MALRIEMDGSRCWHGELLTPKRGRIPRTTDGEPMPRTLDGCVRVRDQVRLFDRLL